MGRQFTDSSAVEEHVGTIDLPILTIGRYQFALNLQQAATFPDYLGAVLRGGFGFTFKDLVCMQKHLPRCADCLLLHTCAYPAVFAPAPPPEADALRNHTNVPTAYVFEPPPVTDQNWPAGATLLFGLTLIGNGVTYLPYFILAMQDLGRRGLGGDRIRADLVQVISLDSAQNTPPIWVAGRLSPQWRNDTLWHTSGIASPVKTSALSIEFQTPTRLKYADDFLHTAPPFHVVIRTLLRRLSSLSYFHGGHRWDTDYRGWIERAEQITIAQADVHWADWERYSTRQERRMNLGGIVGQVTYTGELTPFLPLLRLGELIHVGKGAVFGNGQYVCQV